MSNPQVNASIIKLQYHGIMIVDELLILAEVTGKMNEAENYARQLGRLLDKIITFFSSEENTPKLHS